MALNSHLHISHSPGNIQEDRCTCRIRLDSDRFQVRRCQDWLNTHWCLCGRTREQREDISSLHTDTWRRWSGFVSHLHTFCHQEKVYIRPDTHKQMNPQCWCSCRSYTSPWATYTHLSLKSKQKKHPVTFINHDVVSLHSFPLVFLIYLILCDSTLSREACMRAYVCCRVCVWMCVPMQSLLCDSWNPG